MRLVSVFGVCQLGSRTFCWRIFTRRLRVGFWLWSGLLMRTEKVEVDERFGKEYAGCYVFSEITWARRSRIIQRHTRYNSVTGQVVSSDFVAIQAETVWASLREQPLHKPVTLEKLLGEDEGVSIELGELFSRVANKLCGVTVDEQRFLSER